MIRFNRRRNGWQKTSTFKKGIGAVVVRSYVPARMPLGVIQEAKQGSDGLVRLVLVKASRGCFQRDVRKIYLLEDSDEGDAS